jgi:GNAT superfamily N-acetyltransferase
MSLTIVPVRTLVQLNEFLRLPWEVYKGNKCWVPPMINDLRDSLDRDKNPTLSKLDYELFVAYLDGKPAGRIFTGIDNVLNTKKSTKIGHFSLFECIEDYSVFKLLLDTASKWLKDRGICVMKGPVAPTGTDSDENKGLLIDAFELPPVLMNSYNPPYYKNFLEQYGFEKDYDLFAYFFAIDEMFNKNLVKDPAKAIEYAKKKYHFRVDPIDTHNIEKETEALKQVLDLAVPDEWPDLVPPSLDEVREMANKLVPIADPELIIIARSEDRPIGFGIALPDYNEVLIHLNGRITPLAAVKYLWYKRKINSIRFFIMFVVPEFRKKGVSYAIYYQTFLNAKKKGYAYGEGSTIGETNAGMRADIEKFGGKRYKTYRIFCKNL